jgi:tetratricopeptide (TPR) repeat protein
VASPTLPTPLEQLLHDPEFLPAGPQELLVLLAAAGESPGGEPIEELPWPLDRRLGEAELDAWLCRTLPGEPRPAERERWLNDLSVLDRALQGVSRLPVLAWARPVLSEHLERLEAAVRAASWTWMWAPLAQSQQTLPWRAIETGLARGVFAGPVDPMAFSRLVQGKLHPGDAAALRAALAVPGPWQDAWARWDAARRPGEATPFERAFRALVRARHTPSKGAALALSEHLLSQACVEGMRDAVEALRTGADERPETLGWVALALEGRLRLERCLADDEVLLAAVRIDEIYAPLSDAVLLLDEATWSAIVDDEPLDDEAWWGERAMLAGEVEQLASQARARPPHKPAPVLAHAADRTPVGARPEGPGRVRLLLVAGEEGTSAWLTVSHAPGAAPGRTLGPWAMRGVRMAWLASGRLFRQGPRYLLEDHRIEVQAVSDVDLQIEGQSLALPVALAFASLWTETTIPDDMAATGSIKDDLERIGPVEFVDLKSRVLAASGGARLLVAPSNEGQVQEVDAVVVNKLLDALRVAGIDPKSAGFEPVLGAVHQRIVSLERLLRDAEVQELASHGTPDLSAWQVLADRMVALADSLEPAQRVLAQRALATAAKIYLHGGEIDLAEGIGKRIDRDRLPPSVRMILDIGLLTHAIDRNPSGTGPFCARVEETLDELEPEERVRVAGRALGTIGRAHLHLRDVRRAVQVLAEAVEAHRGFPHELPRSRVYLASALRMAGRIEEALGELQRAQEELVAARAWHPAYERSTRLFWRMELARILVAAGRPAEALPLCRAALAESVWLGLWPQVGLLRVAACAHRALGELAQADVYVRAIEGWLGKHPLVPGLLLEARGEHPEGGEVY